MVLSLYSVFSRRLIKCLIRLGLRLLVLIFLVLPGTGTGLASGFTGAAAAPAAAAAAPALAGAAGGVGGALGILGGPIGMAATAGLGFLSSGFGNIAAKNQMEAQLQGQVEQDKRDDISNYAFQRAFQRANIGDQMQGLQDMRTARKMGLGRP
jgi:hypothetical protein